jgi:hypothetical protein
MARSQDDAFARWQDRSRSSMEFVNNLFLGLAAGLLAVALADGSDKSELIGRAAWEDGLAGAAVVALGLSLVSGIAVALNRLQVTRLTARVPRLRQLRDRVLSRSGGVIGSDWERQTLEHLIPGLTGIEHWTRPNVRKAANSCRPAANLTRPHVMELVKQLRTWSAKADTRTWIGIRAQTLLFFIGALAYGVVPLWGT